MYTILEFSDIIETMLDLTSEHKFEIKFEQLENGKIYAIVSNGIGEILINMEDVNKNDSKDDFNDDEVKDEN